MNITKTVNYRVDLYVLYPCIVHDKQFLLFGGTWA